MSMSGALAYRSDRSEAVFVFQIKEGSYNTESLITFLAELRDHLAPDPVTLIWDGSKVISKALRAFFQRLDQRLRPVPDPLADNEITRSSTPDRRRCRLATIFGSNEESLSRGTAIPTGPASFSTVFTAPPVTRVPAITTGLIVLAIGKMVIHLALRCRLHQHLCPKGQS